MYFVTGGAPSAPPGAIAPPPYSGQGGYGGVVTQQPHVQPYGVMHRSM